MTGIVSIFGNERLVRSGGSHKKTTNEKIFQDDQMIYLLAPHSSALQTDTTKFK